MALYAQFISPLVSDIDRRIEIEIGFTNFFDEKNLHNFFGSNTIDRSHALRPTDVLVHICSSEGERALFHSGTQSDVNGRTSITFEDNTPVEAYSEVWADQLIINFSIDLKDKVGLKNLGRLIAIASLHEAMHNKVESLRQIDQPDFDLHTMGGGGIATAGASIVTVDGIFDAPVIGGNLTLIRAFFNNELKQTRRKM
jgi:hypothetical protein